MNFFRRTLFNRKLLMLVPALVAALALGACGGSSSNERSEPVSEHKSPLFSVRGDWAIMNGEITSKIVDQLNALVAENPQVRTIVMQNVPGSLDDEMNLKAGLRLRELGLNTYLPPGSQIASGGVDLFLAGKERIAAPNVLIGVHSWAGGGVTDASTLDRDHPGHKMFLDYYQALGIDPDFYWFTITAANADNIHWMSVDERQRFGITTRAANDKELNMITAHAQNNRELKALFTQYTWIDSPNNKPIHIFAASDVSTQQIVKARSVMGHYLSNEQGVLNKNAMANKLADQQAGLFMFAKEADAQAAFDGDFGELPLAQHGQDLSATEVFVEGDVRYMNRKPPVARDATYEEVLHLVQGHGLAVAEPALQQRIVAQANRALQSKSWRPSQDDINEWSAELDDNGYTSLNYEYLAAAVEGYYGLWGHADSGLDGYAGINRARQKQRDPGGLALIEEVWPSTIVTMMPISPDFPAGETFSLAFDAKVDYTHQSQFLRHVSLTGRNSSNIRGNDYNNVLQGNAGNNRIDGAAGSEDTVLMKGLRREYQLKATDGAWQIKDIVADRDGIDTLVNIEKVQFTDQVLKLSRPR
ncbi:MAG: hypothetical protein GYB26_11010 [Gammaproteobacteria bacterium]|uniref:Alpha/beta hydrolase family protein n=1 Tax=Marinobacter litoralis TaxID=187981 RepID=A0A3M2R8I0_9GAMM|nr:hypothetical protein [Marinobacter litoralis]MBR9871660.1 hypothetical protein [Gammaproteobacteria bacterium]RMJ01570.1 hypothetical protein DOQ08_03152 [Marinobacter litoralis]